MTDVTTGLRTFRQGRLMVNTLESVHAKTHAGEFFSGGHYSASVADAGTLVLLLQVTDAEFHALFTASASGDCTMQLYTGTTFSNAGTAVSMSNHKLSSSNTCPATLTHTPTVTDNGTVFNGTEFLAGGTKHSGGGGKAGFGNEIIVPVGGVVMFVVTNVSGGAVKMSLSVEGYES